DDHVWSWPDGSVFWRGLIDGEPADDAYVNWQSGEPNNTSTVPDEPERCAALALFDTGWRDRACSLELSYFCEAPLPAPWPPRVRCRLLTHGAEARGSFTDMQRGFSEKAVSHHPPACHLALGIALVLGAACSDEAGAPGSPSSGGGSPAASGGSTSGGGGDTSVGGSSPATGGASTGGTGGTPGTGGSGATAAGGAPGSGGGATGGSSGAGATGGGSGGSGGSGGDVPTAGACAGGVPDGRVMECLGRGVTAVPSGDGTFVS